ncbi:MAG: pyrroline-5-carboxylate reductase [Rubellimicrobium sp.]|nr:pyrroline-5-carboxylate reductase [Rubellimicrobium sp.]
MELDDIARRGLVLLGCGKMGSALLQGWLAAKVPRDAVTVLDPAPSEWLRAQGVRLNSRPPAEPAVLVLAVKPQMMEAALPQVAGFGGGKTLVISIAAGTPLARFEAAFGAATPVIRVMPNTPAAVGRGISALVGNAAATPAHLDLAQALMAVVGQVVRLDSESQIDAVTAVSGSGPAYVFHMVEALAAAGEAEGLAPALAMQLARATVAGAGALLDAAPEDAATLRRNVTSPAGTTEAALAVLMDADTGLPPLLARAVHRARIRSEELSRD